MNFGLALCLFWIAGICAASARPHHYQVRLTNGIASYSKPGTPFQARVIGPMRSGPENLLPSGTVVHGVVRAVHSIGLGFRRERAMLELEFTGCVLPDGSDLPCTANLVSVDNAQEKVTGPNQITGILAASHPNSWLSGLWFRPMPTLFQKSSTGLTGAGGFIHSRMAPTPMAAAAIVSTRIFLFSLPEPEIELPAGAELILKIAANPGIGWSGHDGQIALHLQESLLDGLISQPPEVFMPDKSRAQDIINLAFVGARPNLQQAFAAAGWTTAHPMNGKSFARSYSAFTSMKPYPNAPFSTLHYQGRTPDLVFQKSFNSIAKRHHIRLWSAEVDGRQVWLGAATHDVSVAFDMERLVFTHHIDPHIDRERSTVLNDLAYLGCVSTPVFLPRDYLRRRTADKGPIITDGALAVASLQDCAASETQEQPFLKRKRRIPVLIARRAVLETRQYVTRGNPYYWAYRSVRRAVSPNRKVAGADE